MTALLTAREVAGRLDVVPATIMRWTREGKLPAVRLPSGAYRYPEDQLDRWLAEHATPARGGLSTTTKPGAARGTLISLPSTTTDGEE